MNHIENIQKLFSKSFVESPLLESFDGGKLVITTGEIVASDPLITPDKEAFEEKFPTGEFMVNIHKERESNCVAYAEVVFQESAIENWKLATTKGQNIKDLAEGEIFGYPVESGMGCFMDYETQKLLNELEQEIFQKKADDFEGIYAEFFHEHFYEDDGAVQQYALLKPYAEKENNIFAFEAGLGEGFYASYIAYDVHGIPVKLITEFIEIIVD
ncbi:DUF4241 domain-containing protein [Elizabethkingia meningoseptica]|uniref:DUF4241 domain-containing protein n=1 Tax=Elizabethkingia meningoseptica TaxID=238 RepID=UPI00099A698D|nr:DUF4241 domain-containing protein [Elizabethkingia meningoseptica]MCL1675727.1 DUF4241 domain-containing protein [Elizabethkingia meningoseptica]MCL1686857.1 DUF4241 domain-containing protein [Elizabethkingia meningoseptica]OPB97123.1 hypothetical protein BAS10_08810 [Elizabethkingia meningoseptica]